MLIFTVSCTVSTNTSSSSSSQQPAYRSVAPQIKLPALEKEILARWAKNNTFKRSIEIRKNAKEYVFYDGPPFANGLPHYGHLLTGYVKDIIPRFETMRGHKVERRFGWDCHGLPAEMESEKELKISGRQQIQEYGVEAFNNHCRTSVLRYTNEWESYVTRQARWVDFKNDYKTMDLPYMESVIWAFKQLWDKGLIYEGVRVVPYSWACETPLSNFEIRMDNATRPRQDPALTVVFSLKLLPTESTPTNILAWTTTPWTLPSNLGLAVGADITYAIYEKNGVRYVLAEAAVAKYEQFLEGASLISTAPGSSFVGRSYTPLFPYFKDTPNAFVVMAGAFVSTEDGTGVVHLAPGFGEDDQKLCEAHQIPIVCPVDTRGRFTAEVTEFAGEQVHEGNKSVIRVLKERGILIKHDTIMHNYPHCWRTDTPIIYKAVSSWYVRVTQFKDRMVELNKEIRWIPDHVKDGQFGKWLENARDWSISRSRFWGAPIPVWKSDDPKYPRVDAYGSLDEIERDFGVRPQDLHKPGIDNLVRKNPDDPTGKSMMRRVDDVLDCWFESGSMPFAQMHYPFENKAWFENNFPADFIVEYVAQTRGWFYTLMVLSTAIFDRPPFKNCICHGVVLDEKGQKLSKRLRNYPDPETVFETLGSDALRWFLVSSPILRGLNLEIDKDGKGIGEVVRSVINPIWNSFYFYTLYANSDGIRGTFSTQSTVLIDRYILSKTRHYVESLTRHIEALDLASACQEVTTFLEALNNWYIRRSRERFWKSEKDSDKTDAYNTLYTVLVTLSKSLAPLLPFVAEEIYTTLTEEESVHLTDWPVVDTFPLDEDLTRSMDRVREVCSAGLSLREAYRLRTRLPLQSLTVAGKSPRGLSDFAPLIKDEVNVKEVVFTDTIAPFASIKLQVNAKELGPKLGAALKEVLRMTREGGWSQLADGRVQAGSSILEKGEFQIILAPQQGVAVQALPSQEAVVVLNTTVTQDLEEEGVARDLVRLVQQARKEANLHISDSILLGLKVSSTAQRVLEKYSPYIKEQTLSHEIAFSIPEQPQFAQQATLGEEEISISVSKVG